jgi:predicted membrane-bound mannosyltransferase
MQRSLKQAVSVAVPAGVAAGAVVRQGRRGFLRSSVTAGAAAISGFALLGALDAAPVQAGKIEYCYIDPVITVDVHGKQVAVKLWIGVPAGKTGTLDQPALKASMRAVVADEPDSQGRYATMVWYTIVTKNGASFSVTTYLEAPSQGATSGNVSGVTNVELSNVIKLCAC